MIKDKTRCKIVVGQNGLVWVKGDNDMEQITKKVIHLIEAEAHTSGLTNRIRDKLYLLIDGELPKELKESEESKFGESPLINENNSNLHLNTDSTENPFESNKDELEKPKLENFKDI
jgi:exosome complex component RRP4